jgi:hypothetical protein
MSIHLEQLAELVKSVQYALGLLAALLQTLTGYRGP